MNKVIWLNTEPSYDALRNLLGEVNTQVLAPDGRIVVQKNGIFKTYKVGDSIHLSDFLPVESYAPRYPWSEIESDLRSSK